METVNWREKIERGDIAKAARELGVSAINYARSQKQDVASWTPTMIAINKKIKEIVMDREKDRMEFVNEYPHSQGV